MTHDDTMNAYVDGHALALVNARLAFAAAKGRAAGRPAGVGGGSSAISDWVAASCTPVTINGSSTSICDCAGSVSR